MTHGVIACDHIYQPHNTRPCFTTDKRSCSIHNGQPTAKNCQCQLNEQLHVNRQAESKGMSMAHFGICMQTALATHSSFEPGKRKDVVSGTTVAREEEKGDMEVTGRLFLIENGVTSE